MPDEDWFVLNKEKTQSFAAFLFLFCVDRSRQHSKLKIARYVVSRNSESGGNANFNHKKRIMINDI